MDTLLADILVINLGILAVTGYIVYRKRKELATVPKCHSNRGIVLSIACAVVTLGFATLSIVTYEAYLYRLTAFFAVANAWLVCYALWGWNFAKLLLFPVGYLSLIFVNAMLCDYVLEMQKLMGTVTMSVYKCFGVSVSNVALDGVTLIRPAENAPIMHPFIAGAWVRPDIYPYVASDAGHGFVFWIADACSGIRSLVVLMAIAAPYAYFRLQGLERQWQLFLSSIPLALLSNLLRIVAMSVFAILFTQELAMKWFHTVSGWLVYILAVALLRLAETWIRNSTPRQTRQQLRHGTVSQGQRAARQGGKGL